MSDADTEQSPSEDGTDRKPKDAVAPGDTPEADSDDSAQKGKKPVDERAKKRKSLAERLRKISSRSTSSTTEKPSSPRSSPPVEDSPPDQPAATKDEKGDRNDRSSTDLSLGPLPKPDLSQPSDPEPSPEVDDGTDPAPEVDDDTDPSPEVDDDTDSAPEVDDDTDPSLEVDDATDPSRKIDEDTDPSTPIEGDTTPSLEIDEDTAPSTPIAEDTKPTAPVDEDTAPLESVPNATGEGSDEVYAPTDRVSELPFDVINEPDFDEDTSDQPGDMATEPDHSEGLSSPQPDGDKSPQAANAPTDASPDHHGPPVDPAANTKVPNGVHESDSKWDADDEDPSEEVVTELLSGDELEKAHAEDQILRSDTDRIDSPPVHTMAGPGAPDDGPSTLQSDAEGADNQGLHDGDMPRGKTDHASDDIAPDVPPPPSPSADESPADESSADVLSTHEEIADAPPAAALPQYPPSPSPEDHRSPKPALPDEQRADTGDVAPAVSPPDPDTPSTPSPELAPDNDEPPASLDAATPGPQSPPEKDDDGGDFAATNTELFQSPYDNEPITPRISTLEGPAKGQEFLIHRMRNSVGRGSNNTITVADPSMSRKHFEILQKPNEAFAVRDLQSVNGTELNGVKIKESDLFHGDRLEAGHSTFQFLVPGDVPISTRQRNLVPATNAATASAQSIDDLEGPVKKTAFADRNLFDRALIIITICAIVLSVPLFAFVFYTLVLDDGHVAEQTAYDLYFDGVEAIQNQDWERAEQYFEQSQHADPDFGEAKTQLERIEGERQAQQLIEDVRQKLDDGPMIQRRDELRAIRRDSSYYDDAQSLLQLAEHEEARLLLEDAQQAFDDEEYEESAEKLAEVLAVVPQHEAGQKLEQELQQVLDDSVLDETGDTDELDDDPTPPQRPTAAAQRGDDGPLIDRGVDRSASTDSRGGDGDQGAAINFTDGFSHYRAERFEEAIEHFEVIADSATGTLAARARRTADDIERFQQARQQGRQARSEQRYAAAADHFERARQADQAVARSFEDDIATDLASTLAKQGLERLKDDDYATASGLLERADAHDSSHSDVATLRERLEQRANNLYIRAVDQQERDPAQAIELSRTILTMVPPSHSTHQRARHLLNTLE